MEITFLEKSYLARISESFVNQKWEISDSTVLVLQVIGFLILFSIVISLIQKRRAKKKQALNPSPFAISDRKEIRKIFEKSLEDRSKFELSFSEKHKFSSNCNIVEIKKKSLVLELPMNIVPSSEWKGRNVYLYFSIPTDKSGRRIFYYFESRIITTFSQKDSHFIEIEFPEFLEIKQKRKFFRIWVKNEEFDRIVVYFLPPHSKIETIFDLPKPVFEFKKNNKKEGPLPISLINLSAGGIRIKLSNKLRKETKFDVENPPDILLYLTFSLEGKNKKLLLWCQVKNYNEDHITRDIELGLQFIKQAILDPKDKKKIMWKKIPEQDGHEHIGKWVFLKNLSLIRKGVTE